MNKVLSVAVPAYNVAKYLPDTLASYCAGIVDERLEVIVVDDGSTDSTAALAREFINLFPQIFRLVSKENGGHGSSICAGIDAAQGKYFRVIDGDDRICTANIPALLDVLEAADDDLVVDVRREVNIETGASELCTLPADIPCGVSLDFEDVCDRADLEHCLTIHTTCMRTEFLREHAIRLLEHTFYVDLELVVKVASFARTVRFNNLEACNYYIGNAEQSVAPANFVRRWADHTRVTEEMLRFATETPLSDRRRAFAFERVRLLCNTHLNIALIYDEDRARGLARANEFRAYLQDTYPEFARACEKRYWVALALHYAGIDARKLDRLMGR